MRCQVKICWMVAWLLAIHCMGLGQLPAQPPTPSPGSPEEKPSIQKPSEKKTSLRSPNQDKEKKVAGVFVRFDAEKKVLTLLIEKNKQQFQLNEKTVLLTLSGSPNTYKLKGFNSFRKPGRIFQLTMEKIGDEIRITQVRPLKKFGELPKEGPKNPAEASTDAP